MADKKISALTAATTPLAGTEVLPIVQSGATVKVANNDLRPKQIQSNATSGVLQVVGPAAAATRVMTTPDANFTAARTDAGQTFTGDQTFSSNITANGYSAFGGTTGYPVINNSAKSISGATWTITGNNNGQSCYLYFAYQYYDGWVKKSYFVYNDAGNWYVNAQESASGGAAAPTVTVTGNTTGTVTIAISGGSGSYNSQLIYTMAGTNISKTA